jgi:PAS domain S-box-containing protein
MKIKAKLLLGVGSLFAMILLMTILSAFFVNRLSADTKNILVANYNTVDYCRQMILTLNEDISKPVNENKFRQSLAKQKINVTEEGENALTSKLEMDFNHLMSSPRDSVARQTLIKDIASIMLLNMQAIQKKSALAKDTASTSVFWITLIGTICFIIALTIWFNLPGNIANPIRQLTESIKEIAGQNYSQRIHFEKHNEFGELAAAFNTMAEKLEEYKASNVAKLMMEKMRIEALINNMKDPVIGLDAEKRILFMNNIALQITGLKKDDAIGRTVQDIAVQNDLVRILIKELFMDGGQAPEIKKQPMKIYANGKESYFEKEIVPINITPAGEEAERHIGNVIVLQNITPYKELDFAKTHFIATVSHELKTPISSIKMGLQLLENKSVGDLNEEQKKLVDGIHEDISRLLKITGELLNMTQLESGSIQLNVTSVKVEAIVDYAIKANRAAADQKQIKLEVKVEDHLPDVLADAEKTSWVLNNLLSNAIRYSYEEASVIIEVVKAGTRVKFSVIDSGSGIAPEYVDRIFDKYFRIPGSQKEGTGLGLSISKEFIEAEGGKIFVDSDYGLGSKFSFFLNSVSEAF